MLTKIEGYVSELNKLNLQARLAYLEFLDAYAETRRPETMMRRSMLQNKAASLCRTGEERNVLERLCGVRYKCAEALLEFWLQWLEDPAGLRDIEDWSGAPTRYGIGSDRFVLYLPQRMLAVQPQALNPPHINMSKRHLNAM